jgi:lipopolysaccharide export system protein LptA
VASTFLHNGTYLISDTALWNVETKVIKATGHVKVIQDETVLTSDKLDYYIDDNLVQFTGTLVQLQNKKRNTLRTRYLDSNTRDSIAYFRNGASMRDEKGQIIESLSGSYRSKDKVFTFMDNVNMFSDSVFIKTNRLFYHSDEEKAEFPVYIDFWKGGNMLSAEEGWYNRSAGVFFFRRDVHGLTPEQEMWSDTLYYYSDIKKARIVSPTNITSDDGTFVYGERGDYDTNTDEAFLLDRSYIIKDMRKIVADSLYYCKGKDVSEAFGDVVITDEENLCMLTANYCQYNQTTGFALATDSAVAYEYSQKDTLYVHADTLKMFTYNLNTDSVYRDLHAYHHVRMYRVDVQAVCDSMVTHELDSCTYMYGNPVLWNEGQQAKGDEIRVYNNDSTIDWIHIIGKA